MPYDLIVIGTGPGGYVCAIRAAQLGLKTAVVEKRATHGGTCLNIGCIPSKALLHASELYDEAGHMFAQMGIKVGKPSVDLAAMQKFKDQGVDGNVKGVEYLLKKNKIDAFHGAACIVAPGQVEVTAEDGKTQTLETKNIVIATGSDVARLKGVDIDEKRIVSSTGALELDKVPEKLLIVGAGVIGLELGSVWRRLGSQVTVVEFLDRILPGIDVEIGRQFQRILQKQGIAFKLSCKVTAVDTKGKMLKARIEPAAGGAAETIDADIVLVAIGRVPYTEGLGLESAGVKIDSRGRVIVDAHYHSNVPGIYAIGDVIAGPMLAHKAEDEGIAVSEIIAGQAGHVNYDAIPNVVYTFPEIASVGKTEEELKQAGIAYNVGKFPFTANGRAKVNLTTEGFVKILADAKTDRVLGVHILGADAGNMIAEAVLAMEFGASSEDIARTCHPHPTLTEAVKEAALAVAKRSIQISRMRRVIRWFWVTIALVFLFEAWLWDHLEPIVGWIVDRLPLHHLKARIARWVSRLSPALSLIVFVVPVGLLLPFKLAGLWMMARGYWMGAAGTLFFAKIVGLGSTAFVFDAARQKLLQLDWFRRLYEIVMSWRDWAHALVDPIKERIRARTAMFAPHRAGRAVRLLLRIRRRARTPVVEAKLGPSEAARP